MIPVEKFIEEQEKKPVYFHVYCYYDKALEIFNQPVVDDKTPDFMAQGLRSALLKGTFTPDKAAGLLFVYMGKFDMKTGVMEWFDEPQIIVDCDKVLPKQGVIN